MWDNSDDRMYEVFDFADDGKTKFPIECPRCKKLDAHIFMHRFGTRNGGAWAWCGVCHTFAHMSGILPDWWENLQGIDKSMLSSDLDYLNDQASKIDAWVNTLPRSTPKNKQIENESKTPNDTVICEKCGHEMAYYMGTPSCGMICTNCGWGWVTTYIEPIRLDETKYTLHIPPIKAPPVEVLRCIANFLMCNYLIAREKLKNEIVFTMDAIKIRDTARELKRYGIAYTITPEFPYSMKHDDLNATILYLFNRYWDEDLTEEQESEFDNEAEAAINTYGWNAVFEAANSYLKNNCKDPESVINFAHHYWIYGWHNNDIPNPYNFLAYFYHVLDFKTAEYDDMDILNSLATTMLPRAGYSNADPYIHTDYMPESDKRMIAEARKFYKA